MITFDQDTADNLAAEKEADDLYQELKGLESEKEKSLLLGKSEKVAELESSIQSNKNDLADLSIDDDACQDKIDEWENDSDKWHDECLRPERKRRFNRNDSYGGAEKDDLTSEQTTEYQNWRSAMKDITATYPTYTNTVSWPTFSFMKND